jgi:hypothetical protein
MSFASKKEDKKPAKSKMAAFSDSESDEDPYAK